MTPKYSPICDDPKKYSQNLYTPQNIHFSENPKNETSLRMYENIRVSPLPLGVSAPQPWAPQSSLNLTWPFLCCWCL